METLQTPATPAIGPAGHPEVLNPDHHIVIGGKLYLTEAGLAAIVRKTPRTVARWDALGMGPPRIKVGRLVAYDPEKLPAWLERNERSAEKRSDRGALGGRGRSRGRAAGA